MPERIVIIGAGLIGCAIAEQISRTGAQTVLIDAGQVGTQASGRSFGWINASFFGNTAHHHLRRAGIEAWHDLQKAIPALNVSWPGCLWWQEQGAELDRLHADLLALDYPLERMSRAEISQYFPVGAEVPHEALKFSAEGVAEGGAVTCQLAAVAAQRGVEILTGCHVDGIETTGGKVSGLRVEGGNVPADKVIIAAGTASASLCEPMGVNLPMRRRPGVLVTTRPVPPVLRHIMVAPDLEYRQAADGRIIAPAAASHQADQTVHLTQTPQELAADTLIRLKKYLPDVNLEWESACFALRPVPGDGLPAIGACGPKGLYLACMHSGVTLGALVGKLVANEILTGKAEPALTSFRPQRFMHG